MTMSLMGFRPPDEKWLAHKKVWDACHEAGVPIPPETRAFFEGSEPDPAGIVVDLYSHPCCSGWVSDYADGVEIDVSKLPPQLTKIRIYES